MLRCAISVDLDEIPNYFAIHGVSLDDCDEHAVYERALERLSAWARGHAIPLTLFAVGSDLSRAQSAARLKWMRGEGHEIANHTLDHRYDLTRHSKQEMVHQVRGGIEAIERATGAPPVGFRAPGYVTTDALYEVLSECGVSYSSSVFPCPWYYSPKLAAIGLKRMFGKRSSSLVDDPRVLLAPRRPYRVGVPYWNRGQGLLELPIQVTPNARLPFIGTNIVLGGPTAAAWLARQLVGEPLINLELHGIDVLDKDDGLHSLARHQPDLGISVARKLKALDSVVYTLRKAGYSFCTLAQAAEACADQAAA